MIHLTFRPPDFLLFVSYFRLKDDSLDCVKIADFGLSQFYRPGVLIKCDGSGTLSISAPELLVKPTFDSEENTHATYNFGNCSAPLIF